uniref:Uncharacterized protein n=1 Tax=Rhizophora mucronata TaxID=61149 RepID=A0A2P2P024_RHIMU
MVGGRVDGVGFKRSAGINVERIQSLQLLFAKCIADHVDTVTGALFVERDIHEVVSLAGAFLNGSGMGGRARVLVGCTSDFQAFRIKCQSQL